MQPNPTEYQKNVKEHDIMVSYDSIPIYVYKRSVVKTTVYGVEGYKMSMIWEDEYQYCITDNYQAFDYNVGNGILYTAKVRTYGSKEDTTFEKLEGRRFYFRPLIDKVISTAKIDESYKVCKTKILSK